MAGLHDPDTGSKGRLTSSPARIETIGTLNSILLTRAAQTAQITIPNIVANVCVNLRKLGEGSDRNGFYTNADCVRSDVSFGECELDIQEVQLRTPLVKHVQNI